MTLRVAYLVPYLCTAVLGVAGGIDDANGKIARVPSQTVDQLRPDLQPQPVPSNVRDGGRERRREIRSCDGHDGHDGRGRGRDCRIAETAAGAEMIPRSHKDWRWSCDDRRGFVKVTFQS